MDKYIEQGKCAKCGSDNIDYGGSTTDETGVMYEMSCLDCKAEMHEWYEMTFTGIDLMTEDGEIEYMQVNEPVLDNKGE